MEPAYPPDLAPSAKLKLFFAGQPKRPQFVQEVVLIDCELRKGPSENCGRSHILETKIFDILSREII